MIYTLKTSQFTFTFDSAENAGYIKVDGAEAHRFTFADPKFVELFVNGPSEWSCYDGFTVIRSGDWIFVFGLTAEFKWFKALVPMPSSVKYFYAPGGLIFDDETCVVYDEDIFDDNRSMQVCPEIFEAVTKCPIH